MKLNVFRAGFLTTVQDLGRTGFRQIGVSLGGALDPHALRVANLLVGNNESEAGLEITFGGLQLRFADERIVAWCGGQFDVRVGSRLLPAGHAALARADEELAIAQPKLGCRAWIAISGGIDVPAALGSRSTDWRAKFGGIEGRALRDRDQLALGPLPESAQVLIGLLSAQRFSSWSPSVEWTSTAEAEPTLRFVRGSDWARFAASTRHVLVSEAFVVSHDSDRMGARLEGPELKRNENVDLISEAVAPGTIQVPPNGKPIVLLGDCQTIGGYPKIGHVITGDLPIAAQLRAGDTVRFQEISLTDAHRLLFERQQELERFRIGLSLRE
ncbi:MAG: biotin-dependent carboxyltransferase family protein, partial [Verrucomicrobiota bacterium]|nr:biotin-dependent carboxyltransferase family protein [Verrucomicrobiota bacterium]